jgi:hypothetical protein
VVRNPQWGSRGGRAALAFGDMAMDEDDEAPDGAAAAAAWAAGRAGRKRPVRYSPELAKRLLERLAAGELVYRIAREPGMPTPEAVLKWAKAKPDFAVALAEARRAGGRPIGARGPAFSYCRETAEEVFQRLCEGQSLTAIGADPTMPSLSTLFYWRRRVPAFEELVRLGKEIQAERFCDLGWAMAEAATPETAYLTHVRLGQLRWMAGVMAPKVFKLKPAEPPVAPRSLDLLIRRFEVEVDVATGQRKVVAYCPNPDTGEVEREPDKPRR